MAVEVNGEDVIRLVLQFCEENNLNKTLYVLQNESQVHLNTTSNLDKLLQDCKQGNWDAVLSVTNHLNLPADKLVLLYDQICLELIELKELETAKTLLRETKPLEMLKQSDPARYMKLEGLLVKTFFDHRDAYPDGLTKEKRRAAVANALSTELQVVPPSRLLTLLFNAIKWQQYTGELPAGAKYDLFRGHTATHKAIAESYPETPWKTIKFPDSHPTSVVFSPNGFFFASGSTDGLIELWDSSNCATATSLKYQAKENFMAHNVAVGALAFSRDSEMLASGDEEGLLKVWKVETGLCLRKIPKAHPKAITHITFSRNSENLLSCGKDGTARIYSLKSGNLLRKYAHPYGAVLSACFSTDATMVITAGEDESVRFWDMKTMDEVARFQLDRAKEPTTIHTVSGIPGLPDKYLVCPTSSTAYVINSKGQVVYSLASGNKNGGDFVQCCLSPKGEWLHCAGTDRVLYSFKLSERQLENMIELAEGAITAFAVHPHKNMFVCASKDSKLRSWRSESASAE